MKPGSGFRVVGCFSNWRAAGGPAIPGPRARPCRGKGHGFGPRWGVRSARSWAALRHAIAVEGSTAVSAMRWRPGASARRRRDLCPVRFCACIGDARLRGVRRGAWRARCVLGWRGPGFGSAWRFGASRSVSAWASGVPSSPDRGETRHTPLGDCRGAGGVCPSCSRSSASVRAGAPAAPRFASPASRRRFADFQLRFFALPPRPRGRLGGGILRGLARSVGEPTRPTARGS